MICIMAMGIGYHPPFFVVVLFLNIFLPGDAGHEILNHAQDAGFAVEKLNADR